jgi:arylsulfatase A-like enzyme
MKQLLFLTLFFSLAPSAWAVSGPDLNVVFFLVDDLGWTDLGCYGSDYYQTPNIDRLASEGMRFTDAYAAFCVCSPTRASILTGKSPGRLHITHAIPIQGAERYREELPLIEPIYRKNLPLEEVTIAEALQPHGYATATIGKWHVSHDDAYLPERQGFDLNVAGGWMGNPGDYFYPYKGSWRMTSEHPARSWRLLPDGTEGEYLTDRLTDEAVTFVKQHREQPFFLLLSHYAVHTPLQAKGEVIAKYARKPKGKRHTNERYAAMIESVDESLGRMVKAIAELGLAHRTLIVVTSDNGGFAGATSHEPLRGNKGNFYEGGIRVPLIVAWPGVIEAGSKCSVPVISTDFYPTILDLAGLPLLPQQHVDGRSLAALLKQTGSLEREALYWHEPNYVGPGHPDPARPCGVVRKGRWKLIESLETDRVELYDLANDLAESQNVAAEHPERVAELKQLLAAMRREQHVQMPTSNPRMQ